MVSIPLAWLVSALTIIAAVALALNTRLPVAARLLLGVFLLCLALAGGLLGLRLTYGVLWAARVQPHVGLMVAPLAFLGFRALTQDRQVWRAMRLDLAVITAAHLAIFLEQGAMTDLLLGAVTLVYLLRLAWLLRLGGDAFVHVPPSGYTLLRAAHYACLGLLGLLFAIDLVIALAVLIGGQGSFRQLLLGASGMFTACVFVIALIGVPLMLRRPEPGGIVDDAAPRPAPLSDTEQALLARLDGLMQDKQLYTDGGLTLARIARRLSLPTRDVSGAVNRGRGQNFSRYVNAFRIDHAQRLLAESDLSVTDVMLESGFVSKSSFNAEFRRITGETPSEYRASRAF